MGSEIILLLLAGVGGCHGSRECCASFVRVEGLLLCKSLGRGIFSQIPSKHPLLPRYVNSILRSIYRSSNTPIWTQTPLSKVGVLPLCRMGCLCSGTFWTGRNSWRKKSISMEFQNFHDHYFRRTDGQRRKEIITNNSTKPLRRFLLIWSNPANYSLRILRMVCPSHTKLPRVYNPKRRSSLGRGRINDIQYYRRGSCCVTA